MIYNKSNQRETTKDSILHFSRSNELFVEKRIVKRRRKWTEERKAKASRTAKDILENKNNYTIVKAIDLNI